MILANQAYKCTNNISEPYFDDKKRIAMKVRKKIFKFNIIYKFSFVISMPLLFLLDTSHFILPDWYRLVL